MNRNQLNKVRNVNDSMEAAIQRTSEIKNLIDQMTLRIELIEKMRAFKTLRSLPGDTLAERNKIAEEIMEIIQNGNIDVNGKYLDNLPILILFIRDKYPLPVVETFLNDRHVDVNVRSDNKNKPALTYAIAEKHFSAPGLLLNRNEEDKEFKLDVNLKDGNGNTALMEAIRVCNSDHVSNLLRKKDIQVNLRNTQSYTALMIAVRINGLTIDKKQERVTIVDMLLHRADLDVNAKDQNFFRRTAFMMAIKDIPMVNLFLKRDDLDINLPDFNGNTPLMIAIQNIEINLLEYIYIVEKLLANRDILVNAKNQDGRTAFMIAIECESIPVFDSFLARNDVIWNAVDNSGNTALNIAVIILKNLYEEIQQVPHEQLLERYNKVEKMVNTMIKDHRFDKHLPTLTNIAGDNAHILTVIKGEVSAEGKNEET